MAFCENCGSKLNDNDFFCENCGEKVISSQCDMTEICDEAFQEWSQADAVFSLFQNADWKKLWKQNVSEATDYEVGIILTRENSLLKEFGECSSKSLHDMILNFTISCKRRGVLYYYLDLDNNQVTPRPGTYFPAVDVLEKINRVAPPKYIFILGNEKIVDVATWEDKTDNDSNIESDWCYAALETSSIWEWRRYDFANMFRVGRLPIYPGESFDEFKSYFDTIMCVEHGFTNKKSYSLSALVWEKESDHEYNTFTKGKVDVSPEITLENVKSRFASDTNIYFFNLHGSDNTKYWYGQRGGNYPEAVEPSIFDNMSEPFILAVEACYGARYTGGLTAQNSILLNAITHKCISFLGSSRIAYGRPSPPGSCADVVVGEFLRQISTGKTAGDAFILGMKKLVSSSKNLDDAEVKTIAEFNLYGDPSISIAVENHKSTDNHCSKRLLSGFRSKIEISMPDIRTPVRMELVRINAQIEQMIDDFAFSTYFKDLDQKSAMNHIEQKIFRLSGLNLNQKVYTRKMEYFSQIIKIYFDDIGKIQKVYESK